MDESLVKQSKAFNKMSLRHCIINISPSFQLSQHPILQLNDEFFNSTSFITAKRLLLFQLNLQYKRPLFQLNIHYHNWTISFSTGRPLSQLKDHHYFNLTINITTERSILQRYVLYYSWTTVIIWIELPISQLNVYNHNWTTNFSSELRYYNWTAIIISNITTEPPLYRMNVSYHNWTSIITSKWSLCQMNVHYHS